MTEFVGYKETCPKCHIASVLVPPEAIDRPIERPIFCHSRECRWSGTVAEHFPEMLERLKSRMAETNVERWCPICERNVPALRGSGSCTVCGSGTYDKRAVPPVQAVAKSRGLPPCGLCPAFPCICEAIDHPAHYGGKDDPYEAIKVIEAWNLDFSLGNAVKYISRAGKKNPDKLVEDLEKARWYLDRAIERLKSKK